MLLDGHSAESVASRLGCRVRHCFTTGSEDQIGRAGPVAGTLESRVHELEQELVRVERERDILKKLWAS